MNPVRNDRTTGPGGRLRGAAILVMLALTTVAATSACEVSTETADRVELCATILGKSFTDPFPDDAEKAREKFRERADELDELAEKAPDDKLRDAIRETADNIRNAEIREKGSARTVVGYIAEQNDRIRDLRRTCLDSDDY